MVEPTVKYAEVDTACDVSGLKFVHSRPRIPEDFDAGALELSRMNSDATQSPMISGKPSDLM
jgi:hypothetical protein